MNARPIGYSRRRHGSSYLEIQVAMVLMAIGISGLYSLSVILTRQTSQLETLLPSAEIASINSVRLGNSNETAWAIKLGAYASIDSNHLQSAPENLPLQQGFRRITDNEYSWGFSTYEAPGSEEWVRYGGYPEDNRVEVHRLATHAAHGSYAEFYAHSIPPGEYEVLIYCPRHPEFGTAVPHQIFDGAQWVDTVSVDQTVTVQDHDQSGRWWQRLGVYPLRNGSMRVRILDTPVSGQYVIADAMMLRARRTINVVSPVTTTDGGGARVVVELN